MCVYIYSLCLKINKSQFPACNHVYHCTASCTCGNPIHTCTCVYKSGLVTMNDVDRILEPLYCCTFSCMYLIYREGQFVVISK